MSACAAVDADGNKCLREDGHRGRHARAANNHTANCGKHHCHASGCGEHVNPEMLMCRRHWFMVPMDVRGRVWATYRDGQCDDMQPSEEWHIAADQAICAVAHREFPQLAPPHKCVKGIDARLRSANAPKWGEK